MKTDNILLDKTYSFALKIIELYKQLRFTHKEYDISKQVLRSETSIGANAEVKDSQYIEKIYAAELLTDCEEIIRILTSILKTSKQSLKP